MIDPKKILNGINDFPTLPTVYSALMDLLTNVNTKVSDVADLISKDQATVMKVLRTANSSFYGLSVKVKNISQAITLLGFNEIKNIVISLTFINLFNNTILNRLLNPVDFWKHSIGVGIISRRLAIALGKSNTENFFLGGLLHDIGKLFFYIYATTDYSKTLQNAKTYSLPIQEAEKRYLGYTHTEVGKMIGEKWNLPEDIINAISLHDVGMTATRFDEQTACIHLANISAKILQFGDSGNSTIDKPNPNIWKQLNLPPNTFMNNMIPIINDYNSSIKLFLLN